MRKCEYIPEQPSERGNASRNVPGSPVTAMGVCLYPMRLFSVRKWRIRGGTAIFIALCLNGRGRFLYRPMNNENTMERKYEQWESMRNW